MTKVLQQLAPVFARIALATAFLSAVAGRFGLWTGQLRWESFEKCHARVAALNPWAPPSLIPVLAWSATIAETSLAILLIAGIAKRATAFGASALLLWFAIAMVIADGVKSPLDYSVFSASACALLLALQSKK